MLEGGGGLALRLQQGAEVVVGIAVGGSSAIARR
jgi:hypothetical protein